MFGTYVRPGELLIYPFVEYYQDADAEYAPEEFGYVDDTEYEGKFRGTEELILLVMV